MRIQIRITLAGVCTIGFIYFTINYHYNSENVVNSSKLLEEKSYSEFTNTEVEFKPGNSRSKAVFYNRIGKSGSRSILILAQKLTNMNNFVFSQSSDFEHDRPSEDEVVKEIKKISKLAPPVFYNRHIHYLDFGKYGLPPPIYVNIIRDPIERFSSHYNYMKYGDNEAQVKHPRTDLPDINECVMQNSRFCKENGLMFYMGLYFCGFDSACNGSSKARVDIAKKHISQQYAVIGLLEEFENTVLLLEKMLPEYFMNASYIWRSHQKSASKTKTHKKDFLTEESMEKLRKYDMKDEYEVYFHAKQKFEALKLKYIRQHAT